MVDVRRDDGSAARDLIADEFCSDKLRYRSTEVITRVRSARRPFGAVFQRFLAADVFAYRDILHLRRNDAFPGVVHLADVAACLRAEDRPACRVGESLRRYMLAIPVLAGGRLIARSRQLFDIATGKDPI